jgi:8-oxo-dGTP pyrophosphatase MutT (NUDIX family)
MIQKSSVPKISGSLIILNGDDNFKVLMLKRAINLSFGSTYSFPGGKLDPKD